MRKEPKQADEDVKLLLKEIMPRTQEGLQKQMGFRPLAAVVACDGSVRRIDANQGAGMAEEGSLNGEVPPTREAVLLLQRQLRREVEQGAVRSAAVAADVMIWRKADGDEASNAVSVHVEHQDGYCVDLLIPYKVRKGLLSKITSRPTVMFRKMVAQESEAVLWPVRPQ